MRFIALDVHRDFCEVAIADGGRVRLAGRVETKPATLELFAQSLAADDQVVLEATGNAVAIARILEPYVGRVVLANPKAVKSATQTAKTDKLDARTLAKLLAAGFLPEVAGRADACPASTDLPPRSAGAAAHTREEPGARDPDPQPQAALAGG